MYPVVLAVFSLVLLTARAQALPDFPEPLQQASDAPCLPHCNVCHRDDNAGEGTVDQPFAINMERVGGLGGDRASVTSAVQFLREAATDSDGDGVPDIEELAMGQSPNDAHPTSLCGPEVGCSTGRAASVPWLELAASLGLLGWWRRRRA